MSFALAAAALVDSTAVGVEDVLFVCFELPSVVCDMNFNTDQGEDNKTAVVVVDDGKAAELVRDPDHRTQQNVPGNCFRKLATALYRILVQGTLVIWELIYFLSLGFNRAHLAADTSVGVFLEK